MNSNNLGSKISEEKKAHGHSIETVQGISTVKSRREEKATHRSVTSTRNPRTCPVKSESM